MQQSEKPIDCRVCHHDARFFFHKSVLGKYSVAYYKCSGCGSVQTETPYWLEEAYSGFTYQRDVGMVQRSILSAKTTASLAFHFDIDPQDYCLDWGAGTGLFVRLCRDYGMNFFYHDPFAKNVFALGFERQEASWPKECALVTAFEVAEHFANPPADFGILFQLAPRFLLISSLLYEQQDPNWWYFTNDGQHVFFHTRRSLELIGRHHGYSVASDGKGLHLFTREPLSDRLLIKCRKNREKWSECFLARHGSRTQSDFDMMTAALDAKFRKLGK